MQHAIKSVAPDGSFWAEAVRYGDPTTPDRSQFRDFFTPATKLMLDDFGWPRPILLEHWLPGRATGDPVVGRWTGYKRTSDGVLIRGQLDPSQPGYQKLCSEINSGAYFISTDSAPHLVRRRPRGTANELTSFPAITWSLTKTPAETRLRPVASFDGAYKTIGRALPSTAQPTPPPVPCFFGLDRTCDRETARDLFRTLPAAVQWKVVSAPVVQDGSLKSLGDAGRSDIRINAPHILTTEQLQKVLLHEWAHVYLDHAVKVADGRCTAYAAEIEAHETVRKWQREVRSADDDRQYRAFRPVSWRRGG